MGKVLEELVEEVYVLVGWNDQPRLGEEREGRKVSSAGWMRGRLPGLPGSGELLT